MQAAQLKTNKVGSEQLTKSQPSIDVQAEQSANKSNIKQSNIVAIQKPCSLSRTLEAYGDCV